MFQEPKLTGEITQTVQFTIFNKFPLKHKHIVSDHLVCLVTCMQDYRKYTVPTGVCGNPIPTEVCGYLVPIVDCGNLVPMAVFGNLVPINFYGSFGAI